MSAFGITCNTVLQAYTTEQIRASFAGNAIVIATGTFGLAFLIEQVLRLIGWLISVLVPNVPARVRESSKTKEKREMAKRRWADIHAQKQPNALQQQPERAGGSTDTLPSLNG